MASKAVQIERWQGTNMAFVRSRASDAPETHKDVLRSITYDILRETCIPAEYQHHAGVLASLLFGFSEQTALYVEIRWFDGVNVWVADALVDDGDQTVYRRGTASTPVDALVALAFDIQQGGGQR